MQRLSRLLTMAAAAVLMAWTPCLAQQTSNDQIRPRWQCQERFKAMDTNHDGRVTKAEFMAGPHRRSMARQRFKTMAQGKGYITKDEFCANNRGAGRGGGKGKGGKQ